MTTQTHTRPALFPCRRCKSTLWAVQPTTWAPRVTCATCGKFVGYDRHEAPDRPQTHDDRSPDIRRPSMAQAAPAKPAEAQASRQHGKSASSKPTSATPAATSADSAGELLLWQEEAGINR